jgi:hypothetical protein
MGIEGKSGRLADHAHGRPREVREAAARVASCRPGRRLVEVAGADGIQDVAAANEPVADSGEAS